MFRSLLRSLQLLLLLPLGAHALGPHEVLLLVNARSPRSMEIANHYAHLRRIPPANIVYLRPPDSALFPGSYITREEFAQTIWEPAQAAIRERGIGDRILAWAYSADFPVLIGGDPQVSLTGLTFVRNQLPRAEEINKGTYTSRLFAGPGPDLKRRGTPGSLEQYAMRLTTEMPLPGMLLAHTGARGESTAQAVRRLESGIRLQGTPPAGQVFLLTSDDIRTQCRSWQFADTVAELNKLGQKAQMLPLTNATPASTAWGIMAGVAELNPARLPRLAPGSLAEHLTSFAGIFHGHTYQTKMTAWLQAGAAATAGTVTEPMSIWTKFPHARMFVHYASGCTVLEALAQSIASPLQTLAIGDPLLAPFGRPQGVTLINLRDASENIRGIAEFAASSWAGPPTGDGGLFFLVDGRSVVGTGQPPVARINTEEWADGWHEIRAVLYAGGAVRHQGFTTLGFTTSNRGRSIRLLNIASNETLALNQPRELQVEVTPPCDQLALMRNADVVEKQPLTTQSVFRLNPAVLGRGQVQLQLAALYDDGEVVRSVPLPVQIVAGDPDASAYAARAGTSWQPLRLTERLLDGTLQTLHDEVVTLRAETDFALARSEVNPDPAAEWVASLVLTDGEQSRLHQRMTLAFDVKNAENFCYAEWNGEVGAWSVGRRVDGVWKPLREVGATLEAHHTYVVQLIQETGGGVTLYVDGDPLIQNVDLSLKGPFGIGAGTSPLKVLKTGIWKKQEP